MSLDPAFFGTLRDYTGMPPAWVLLILYSESGLDPAARNSIGCVGLNQLCPLQDGTYPYGVDPDDYVTWPASRQLSTVVLPFFDAQIKYLGFLPATPGVGYSLNYLPGRVKARLSPTMTAAEAASVVLAAKPESYYTDNRSLDVNKDGAITIGDLDAVLFRLSQATGYKNALAQLQAPPPYPAPPVGGDPSVFDAKSALVIAAVAAGVGLVGGAGYAAWKTHGRPSMKRLLSPRANPNTRDLYVAGGAVLTAAAVVGGILHFATPTESKSAALSPIPTGDFVFPILDSPGANIHFSDDFNDGSNPNFRKHSGNDIFAVKGTTIVAPFAGKLTFTDDGIPGGPGCPPPLSYHLQAADGRFSFGTHLDSFIGGQLGDSREVAAGEAIGVVGNGGNACHTDAHLHFEIHVNGKPVDPYPFLIAAPRLTSAVALVS